MKENASHSKKGRRPISRREITLGYLWYWGSIAMIFLLPVLAFGVGCLLGSEPKDRVLIAFFTMGITTFCVGAYNIIGTALEFKHLIVASQLGPHNPTTTPKRAISGWTKSTKREYITIGIIFAFSGGLMITVLVLFQLGVLK